MSTAAPLLGNCIKVRTYLTSTFCPLAAGLYILMFWLFNIHTFLPHYILVGTRACANDTRRKERTTGEIVSFYYTVESACEIVPVRLPNRRVKNGEDGQIFANKSISPKLHLSITFYIIFYYYWIQLKQVWTGNFLWGRASPKSSPSFNWELFWRVSHAGRIHNHHIQVLLAKEHT